MAANTIVRARVNEDAGDRATAVLADLGLTVSDLTPNTLTADSLAQSDRGEDLHQVADTEDLFERLGI